MELGSILLPFPSCRCRMAHDGPAIFFGWTSVGRLDDKAEPCGIWIVIAAGQLCRSRRWL